MRTNKCGSGNYGFGIHKGRLAYETRNGNKSYLIVFTNISGKRYANASWSSDRIIEGTRELHHNKRYGDKLIFITNEQLLSGNHPFSDWGFIADVMNIAFDGKIGTSYQTKSSCGHYFWCKRTGVPQVRK